MLACWLALCGVHPVLQDFSDHVRERSIVFCCFGFEKGEEIQRKPDGDLPGGVGDVMVRWCLGHAAYMLRYALHVNSACPDRDIARPLAVPHTTKENVDAFDGSQSPAGGVRSGASPQIALLSFTPASLAFAASSARHFAASASTPDQAVLCFWRCAMAGRMADAGCPRRRANVARQLAGTAACRCSGWPACRPSGFAAVFWRPDCVHSFARPLVCAGAA